MSNPADEDVAEVLRLIEEQKARKAQKAKQRLIISAEFGPLQEKCQRLLSPMKTADNKTRADLTLSIDIGTGSVRAALVDATGAILHIAAREHDQIVPQFGWAEQRPLDRWAGVSASIRDALSAIEGARDRVAAVSACGQMHGVVLIDEAGRLTRDAAPLWNDKRTAAIVAEFEREHAASAYLAESGNPPTSA